jgi:hypothetical protein
VAAVEIATRRDPSQPAVTRGHPLAARVPCALRKNRLVPGSSAGFPRALLFGRLEKTATRRPMGLNLLRRKNEECDELAKTMAYRKPHPLIVQKASITL